MTGSDCGPHCGLGPTVEDNGAVFNSPELSASPGSLYDEERLISAAEAAEPVLFIEAGVSMYGLLRESVGRRECRRVTESC